MRSRSPVPPARLTLAFLGSGATARPVNDRYSHGVMKVGAHDKTSDEPVTTFKRSTKLYRLAVGYNAGLDRDGIVCEQH
jgi:hypothetical protein